MSTEAGPGPAGAVRGSRRRRKLRSKAWDFFAVVEARESARCLFCEVIIRTTGGSTSSLTRHLASHHGGFSGGRSLGSLRRELATQKENGSGPRVRGGEGGGGGKKFRGLIRLDQTVPKPRKECHEVGVPVDTGGGEDGPPLQGATSWGRPGPRDLRSPMWAFFTPVVPKKSASCNFCKSVIGTHRGSTTSLVRHMRSMHGDRLGGLGLKKEMVLKRKANTTRPSSVVKIDPDGDSVQREERNKEEGGGHVPEDQKTLVGNRRRRQTRSWTWNFFAPVIRKHSARCKICAVVLKTPYGSTSSLVRHLESKHGGEDLKSRRREMFMARHRDSSWDRRPKVIVKIDLDDEDNDRDQDQGADDDPLRENDEEGEPEAQKLGGKRGSDWADTSRLRKRTAKEKVVSDLSEGDDPKEVADVSMDGFETSDEEFRMDDPLLQSDHDEDEETAPRNKSKVKSSTSWKAITARDKFEAKETCFVCRANFPSRSGSQFSEKEYHFFFKDMLEIPTGKTMNYLEQLERPEKWIGLCNSCQSLIGESLSAKRKIISLQLQIENCQRMVLKKLKSNRGRKEFLDYPKKQRQAVKGIKEFVQSKNYSVLDLEENMNLTASAIDDDIGGSDSELVPDEDSRLSPQALYCGLCDDDTVYETAAQLTAHTTEAHTSDIDSENNEALLPGTGTSHTSQTPELDKWIAKRIPGQSHQSQRYRYDCPNCPDVKGCNLTQFVQHLAIHRRRPYQCTICLSFLPEDKDLQENHWKKNHSDIELPPSTDRYVQIKFSPGKIWNCESCLVGFFSEEARDRHELGCVPPATLKKRRSLPLTKSKPHQCQLCDGLRFRDIAEWRFHRALHHPEVDSMSCYYCDESFRETTLEGVDARHDQKMVDHMQTEHGTIKLLPECEPCGLVFEPGMEITRHMKERHGTPANKVYSCSFCDMSYADPRGIRRHMAHIHFERHSSICETCGAKFLQTLSLNHHIFREHGIVPEGQEVLDCPEEGCSYQTILLGKLNIHMDQVHEAQGRRFICSSCGKGFTTGAYLRQHEDTHKNKELKPFRCEVCGASFAIKYYLNVHRKLQHEGKKYKERKRAQIDPGRMEENYLEADVAGAYEATPVPTTSSTEVSQPEWQPNNMLNM